MHHNIFRFSLVLISLISCHPWTFNMGGDDSRQNTDSSKMSLGPSGAIRTNMEGSGSAHSPTSDYSWGWGSSPQGGWGYGSGSSRSSSGSGTRSGFGFGFGYGSSDAPKMSPSGESSVRKNGDKDCPPPAYGNKNQHG